ncbi:MAG: PilZ domain-containing protein [Vulcanococcus sp.]|nr:PilZ domain-containing protein [Vulcanococcus sp.]
MNDRSTQRRRTRGPARARLAHPIGLSSPVWVDVVDLSETGVGLIVPQEPNWSAGGRWLLEIPLRDGSTMQRLVEVCWVLHDDLLCSMGCRFVDRDASGKADEVLSDASGLKGSSDSPLA